MPDWRIEALDKSPQTKKRRRWSPGPPDGIDTLPADWKALAARWLKRGAASASRWETLAADAGPEQYPLAQRVLEWLVGAGWVALIETRRHGDWWPTRVEFLHPEGLRNALGLPDPAAPARRMAELRGLLDARAHPDLEAALMELDALPASRAAARAELLLALARWRVEGRAGSRRDFALAARGGTKSVSEAEWRWLEDAVDLAAFAIERHTPLLLIAASFVLVLPGGDLPLAASPDFAALTPATLAGAQGIHGQPRRWRLVENRTSFERLARSREADVAVVWLPGYPPAWWRESMAALLILAPAPAEIACDPDPAGIAIALEAACVWEQAALPWQAWRMEARRLAELPARPPLNATDRDILARLRPGLPAMLAELAEWMAEHGEKGEQEGYL
jgi:hypothetical protein